MYLSQYVDYYLSAHPCLMIPISVVHQIRRFLNTSMTVLYSVLTQIRLFISSVQSGPICRKCPEGYFIYGATLKSWLSSIECSWQKPTFYIDMFIWPSWDATYNWTICPATYVVSTSFKQLLGIHSNFTVVFRTVIWVACIKLHNYFEN